MRKYFLALCVLINFISNSHADRGPVIWSENVKLTQESQKAIILHNTTDEVLILGTELSADRETDVLEFIPFPSEPTVTRAPVDTFEKISRIISDKKLMFQHQESFTKGGRGDTRTVPVEIRLSEKIGAHDVTVIKINDINHFSQWLGDFFKRKGIVADRDRLSHVYHNASDYMKRGFNHFVFDFVRITNRTQFIEPLAYRFKTKNIYYPLKTSNLFGGRGVVELIFIVPGSMNDRIWGHIRNCFPAGSDVTVNLSSSSKIEPGEVDSIYPAGQFFNKTAKIYLQMLKYSGPYTFKDDFMYSTVALVPYGYKHRISRWRSTEQAFDPPFTSAEKRDLREAFCEKVGPQSIIAMGDYGIECWDYISNSEYVVYRALVKSMKLQGVPSGHVVLENSTSRKTSKDRKIDKDMLKDFNDKNRAQYRLEHVIDSDGKPYVVLRGDKPVNPLFSEGRTYVSRVGFNKEKTSAMVHVSHVAGPRSGIGYFVMLAGQGDEWKIEGSYADEMY